MPVCIIQFVYCICIKMPNLYNITNILYACLYLISLSATLVTKFINVSCYRIVSFWAEQQMPLSEKHFNISFLADCTEVICTSSYTKNEANTSYAKDVTLHEFCLILPVLGWSSLAVKRDLRLR